MITNPVGIDKPIQELQQLFISELWPNIAASKKSYNHRVFKNERRGLIIPEIYKGNREYEEVKFNDNLTVLSWFDVSEESDNYIFGDNEREVGIFFAVNLEELYPTLSHRAVEESHKDAIQVIQKKQRLFKRPYNIIEREGAYGDYDIGNLKKYNMQPWHVFRINCNVLFTINC